MKKKPTLIILLLIVILVGGGIWGYLWHFGESQMIDRARSHRSVGDLSKAIDDYKECIKKHASWPAQLDLIEIYVTHEMYEEFVVFAMEAEIDHGYSINEMVLSDLAEGFVTFASKAVDEEDWQRAGDIYCAGSNLLKHDLTIFVPSASALMSSMRFLRNACLAAHRGSDIGRLRRYSRLFNDIYNEEDNMKELKRAEMNSKADEYSKEIQDWLSWLE